MLYIYQIGHDPKESELFAFPDVRVIAFPIDDWDAELTPWPAPGISKGRFFSGHAEQTLDRLLLFITHYEKENGLPDQRGIAGYSLAGLFSLWALTQTDLFSLCASISGSLWYDDWCDYLQAHPPKATPERVWLSVGDREKSTRNSRMKTVEEKARETAAILTRQGIACRYSLLPGGHFDHVDERIQLAYRYLAGIDKTK